MAFNAITTNEIATGMPNANSMLTKVKDNFDNHEARIDSLESGGNIDYPPIILRVNGGYSQYSVMTGAGLLKTTCNFNLTVTGVRLLIDVAGVSGTTEIDLTVKSGVGSYTSIFTTKPSVSFSDGNDAISSNAVLDATKVNLLAGDIIKLDLTSSQLGGKSFLVRIDFNKT